MTKEQAKQRAREIIHPKWSLTSGEMGRLTHQVSDALLAAYREGQESMKPKPKPCERCGKLSGSVFCSINCYAESEETL